MKCLVVHPLKAPMSIEEGIPLMKRIAGSMTYDAYWVASWLQGTSEGKAVKVLCRWDGTSVEAVRKAVTTLCPELPLEGVYPMMTMDSGDFR
jgi:hypothetical protein